MLTDFDYFNIENMNKIVQQDFTSRVRCVITKSEKKT